MARRTKGIRVPVAEEELETIRENAKNSNLQMATYLRMLGLKKGEEK